MSSRPFSLNVYHSKRRQRSISNPQGRPLLSSSPMQVLPAGDEDITITEMTHRMKKKSRASLKRLFSGDAPKSASVGTSPSDVSENTRPAKRSKVQVQRTPLAELTQVDNNAPSIPFEEGTQDMHMDMTSVAELKTPAISPCPTNPPKLKAPPTDIDASEQDEESDFLSPLPTSKFAKRVTAHRSSSSLKEAAQKDADGFLASPFNSRPGSPGHMHASKENRDKRINRTRSVGNDLRRRAALRSLSRAESPASNASSPGITKSSETQAWTVPAHIKQSISQKTPRRLSETSVLPASETSFFDFSPIACSTPNTKPVLTLTPPSQRDVDATPKIPPLNLNAFSDINDSMNLDDPTPRAPIHADSLLLAHINAQPFASVQERIISSSSAANMTRSSSERSDLSKSLTISGSSTLAPPSSPAHIQSAHGIISPPTTEGDELGDMFSILELEEDEAWYQADPGSTRCSSTGRKVPRIIRGAAERKKRSSLSARDHNERLDNASLALKRSSKLSAAKSTKRVSIELPASSVSRARIRAPTKKAAAKHHGHEGAMSPQLPQSGQNLPTMRMRILNSPIVPSSDSSDELLLQSSKPQKKKN